MLMKPHSRYLSEEAVKRALHIDSFRNLSKDKVMKFASMIPYMDKDVALSIINQFPTFADFGKTIISSYMEMCNSILARNNESQAAVIQGYQTILTALSKKMDNPEITEDERKSLTEDMISVADKIAEADLQNKKFLERMGTKALLCVSVIFAGIAAGIGINSVLGGDSIPEICEDADDTDDSEDM